MFVRLPSVDYIVDCFGGIETPLPKKFESPSPDDYIVDCFGGIETFVVIKVPVFMCDYIVDCFGGIETNI